MPRTRKVAPTEDAVQLQVLVRHLKDMASQLNIIIETLEGSRKRGRSSAPRAFPWLVGKACHPVLSRPPRRPPPKAKK